MRHIIVGNGVAGTEAAKNIRKRDSLAEIIIFTQDHYPFYSRPRLPEVLAREAAAENIFVHNLEWYHTNKIQLYLNCSVKDVDPYNQGVSLADGSRFAYDKLLFAMGSSGALPPIEGISASEGIFTMRTVGDVMAITRRAARAKTVTLIGGGLLGLEAGNGLRKLGLSVTIVEIFGRLLPRQLDAEGAAMLQKQMEDMGLRFVLGAKSKSIQDEGATKRLTLHDGRAIEGDFILVSAGVIPNIALARTAGAAVEKGIVVNGSMETNVPNIYAAGDVAEHKGRLYGIWPAAQRQGVVAGTNMAGGHETYMGAVPFTTLKVAGIHLTSLGDVFTEDTTVEQIKVKDTVRNVYKKLFLKEGKLIGAIFLGDTKHAYEMGQIMERKVDVGKYKEKLLDATFDIKTLLSAQT